MNCTEESRVFTIALSIEALERTVRAEYALWAYLNGDIDPPPLLRDDSRDKLHEAIRHSIALTILNMARVVKSTDIDRGGPTVTVEISMDGRDAADVGPSALRKAMETCVAARVMRGWLGYPAICPELPPPIGRPPRNG